MCSACKEKWKCASKKKRVRCRCMRLGSQQDLLVRACTTSWLSHLHWTAWPCQCFPQTAAEITMGTTSFSVAMFCCFSCLLPYGNWNQCYCQTAPAPRLPEASDSNSNDVDGECGTYTERKDTLFHCSK